MDLAHTENLDYGGTYPFSIWWSNLLDKTMIGEQLVSNSHENTSEKKKNIGFLISFCVKRGNVCVVLEFWEMIILSL